MPPFASERGSSALLSALGGTIRTCPSPESAPGSPPPTPYPPMAASSSRGYLLLVTHQEEPTVAFPHTSRHRRARSWNSCCSSTRLPSHSAPPFDSRDASWPPCPHPAVSTRGPYSGRDDGTSRRAERVAMTLRPESMTPDKQGGARIARAAALRPALRERQRPIMALI